MCPDAEKAHCFSYKLMGQAGPRPPDHRGSRRPPPGCPGGAGVQLNGAQVATAYLKGGDELVVGRSRFRVSAGPAGG